MEMLQMLDPAMLRNGDASTDKSWSLICRAETAVLMENDRILNVSRDENIRGNVPTRRVDKRNPRDVGAR
jgi:hypothetical protein